MSHKVERFVKLSSGYNIPSVALGTWLLSGSEASNVVYNALKKGYRHFDTAILYDNEREVGEAIAKWLREDPVNNKREDVFYTSKLWTFNSYERTKKEINSALSAIEHSIGYIDLLLLHHPNPGPQGRLDAWRALQEVVETGKVKSIGVSSWGKHHIDQLLSWDGLKIKPAINQIEIHPWCMRQELADYSRSKGIAVEAYAPLAHGGKINDPNVVKIAKTHGVTPGQVLIRWSLQKGNIPLPKTKNVDRLSSNLDVYNFELSSEEIETISHPEAYEPTDWDVTTRP
ncbi:Aldose reductase [Wickerhamomyces ciferrii]|uniref:Aldose reductase n=1 Tax=Wickerhamomyces ciferrii (strain ATCC 14091 / BCRC 22168 / CBS 111 / JCM 3599 / NBRC 0793 / NRRL Y-1031 F-60-10) TaxID=1206466 RepID=K0KIS8_WICCF|nr:Aldose reductase [Wickerhamomyces ciferrii]CCH41304.1 Aldose reductase [Wickerhamomyces ciferrii]